MRQQAGEVCPLSEPLDYTISRDILIIQQEVNVVEDLCCSCICVHFHY